MRSMSKVDSCLRQSFCLVTCKMELFRFCLYELGSCVPYFQDSSIAAVDVLGQVQRHSSKHVMNWCLKLAAANTPDKEPSRE
jgi:hypothetical protein